MVSTASFHHNGLGVMVTDNQEIGKMLTSAREAAGLGIEYMARKYGCRTGHLSMVETGRREATARMIQMYAAETKHPEIGLALMGWDISNVMSILEAGVRGKMALQILTG